jgi:zinc transporter ZupT
MNNDPREVIVRAAVRVLPRLVAAVLGCLLLLGIAVLILTEGAGMVRHLTDHLSQPWRSLTFTTVLSGSVITLALFGRKFMEYIIFTKRGSGDQR